jgi:hypothetical protein
MSSHFFNEAKRAYANKELDWDTDTVKAILLMTNTTADTDYDVNTVSAIGTLDEMDGSGFTWGHGNTGRKTLTASISEVTGGPGTGYAMLDGVNLTWATLGAGTRAVQGVLVAKEGAADDTTAVPEVWVEFASPFTANGGDLTVSWHADGIVKLGYNA